MDAVGLKIFLKAFRLPLAILLLYALVTETLALMDVSGGKPTPGVRYANFIQDKFVYLNITPVRKRLVEQSIQCALSCLVTLPCFSFNLAAFQDSNDKLLCEHLPSDKYNNSDQFVASKVFHHFSILSPCSSWSCNGNGKCMPLYAENSYVCVCKTGFTGENCQNDIDECSAGNKCDLTALCTNTEGSYYCTCHEGYTGDGRKCIVTGCSKVPNPRVSGIYNIRLNDTFGHFPVYCDQTSDGGGWTMIFKVVANATPLYVAEMWKSRNTTSENVTAALDTSSTFNGHYKNRLVLSENWNTFNPKEVRVALYKDGQEVQSLKFNAVNDNVEWFTKKYLKFSTWDDLMSNSSLEHFELQPITEKAKDVLRSFEISEKYSGCAKDVGWLMISTDTNPCAFEIKNPLSILYSKKKGSSVYNSEDMGLADVFAVFIR
ncbi:uncharacterized protein [Montipora capricornis]|uniref:uncharacterized protein isoform X1 n=1 Tax=Montipora capricornis TaxID=246305 RepID=UPI0035F1B871